MKVSGLGERGAWLITLAVVGLVAHPAFRDEQGDSFPLSSYPMFSQPRSRVETLPSAVVVTPDGSPTVLPPEAFGTDNVMQTVTTLWESIRRGPQAALSLCQQLAQHPRVTGAGDGADDETRSRAELRIVLATFDVIDYFEGNAVPKSEQIVARCPVAAPQ